MACFAKCVHLALATNGADDAGRPHFLDGASEEEILGTAGKQGLQGNRRLMNSSQKVTFNRKKDPNKIKFFATLETKFAALLKRDLDPWFEDAANESLVNRLLGIGENPETPSVRFYKRPCELEGGEPVRGFIETKEPKETRVFATKINDAVKERLEILNESPSFEDLNLNKITSPFRNAVKVKLENVFQDALKERPKDLIEALKRLKTDIFKLDIVNHGALKFNTVVHQDLAGVKVNCIINTKLTDFHTKFWRHSSLRNSSVFEFSYDEHIQKVTWETSDGEIDINRLPRPISSGDPETQPSKKTKKPKKKKKRGKKGKNKNK